MCRPVNNIFLVQFQKIPPLLGQQGSCNSSAPLAWAGLPLLPQPELSWSFPHWQYFDLQTTVCQNRCYGNTIISAAHCQCPGSSPAHLPRLGGQPSSQGNVHWCQGCSQIVPPLHLLLPFLTLWGSNQPMKIGLPWRKTKKCLPR